MKKFLMIAVIALVAVACNKNQRAVKKLDGTWNATAFTVSDGATTVDYLSLGFTYTMMFDGCKLKDDEYCNMTTTATFAGDTESSTSLYRVTSDGEKMENKENEASTSVDVINIVELTKSTLKLSQTDDGETLNITLEKQ